MEGKALQLLRKMSGAVISLDQGTRGAGYSTLRISGEPTAVAEAKKLVKLRLAKVHTSVVPASSHAPQPALKQQSHRAAPIHDIASRHSSYVIAMHRAPPEKPVLPMA